jgi:ribosomal protein S18 acetylase RimI-like enzyme
MSRALTMIPVTTRMATTKDIAGVARLFDAYRQFYEKPADLALATTYIGERIRNRESIIIVAERQERDLLGFCQLYPTFCSVEVVPTLSLYDLFVWPAARRRGMGKKLLLAAEHYAARNGFARMDLMTAKTNIRAQALYESHGWVRDTVFYAYSKSVEG